MRPTTQRLDLAPHLSSARHARRFVHDALQQFGAGAVADVGVLLTSELVTNALLHGTGDVAVSVTAGKGRNVRVSVADGSSAPPAPRHAGTDDLSGRGLNLVEILADAWGVEQSSAEGGKEVWFELSY